MGDRHIEALERAVHQRHQERPLVLALEHGALDMIVDRREMRDRIGAMLRLLSGKEPAAAA